MRQNHCVVFAIWLTGCQVGGTADHKLLLMVALYSSERWMIVELAVTRSVQVQTDIAASVSQVQQIFLAVTVLAQHES